MNTDRYVLDIPVDISLEEFADHCRIKKDSAAFDMLEDLYPLIQEFGAPKAIIRRARIDSITGDMTTIEGVTFRSRLVAEKLKDTPYVFLSVITAGNGLESSEEFRTDPFIDTYNGAMLFHASCYVVDHLKERFGFDGSSMLNPGSLPDWPISNNFELFDLIGNVGEIGVSLNEAGYIRPWNSGSHIHFSGDGFHNCSLCKKLNCIGRRAAFDREEYVRIFGTEP